ncbi:WhiB family transcriptional regulator [Kitasatospora sp. NPDC059648]|uniref:WhiB family transcriptional regulator n=1 Tax=Kitasatospora sp. NPDC059648 TaxID=3346894 RepID=UPI003677C1CB
MADLSRPLPAAPERHRSPEPRGACRTSEGAAPFLPAPAHRTTVQDAREREAAAKAVCAGCAVRVECRRHALAVREPYGVRGGLTASERRALFTADPAPAAA